MDEDIQFPNPVVRHDLPVKRARRKYVVAGAAVATLLIVVFLPQILHTSIGTRILKQYLDSRLGGDVSLGGVRTSWFGGTTIDKFAVRDAEGHVIGFIHFQGDVSLGQWMRGSWHLGNATVAGLYIDYIVDDGFGKGTALPANPPRLSGNLSFNDAIIVLSRSRLEAGSLSKINDVQKLSHVSGKVTFPPQGPWTFAVDAQVGDEAAVNSGTVAASGSIAPGAGNSLAIAAMRGDVTVSAQHVATTPLAWILCPAWTQDEYRAALGPTLDDLQFTGKLDDGKLAATLQADGAVGKMRCEPSFNMTATPTMIAMSDAGSPGTGSAGNGAAPFAGGAASPGADRSAVQASPARPPTNNTQHATSTPGNYVAAALSPRIARDQLAAVNPLLRYATGEGRFVLRVTSLLMPATRSSSQLQLRGDLTLMGVKLDAPPSNDAGPATSLLRQLATLAGEPGPSWTLDSAPQRFSIDNGRVTLSPAVFTFNGAALETWGIGATTGPLNMSLAIVSDPKLFTAAPSLATLAAPPVNSASLSPPAAKWVIPLTGTADSPSLDLDAATHSLPQGLAGPFTDALTRFAAELHAVDNERAAGGSAGKVVNDILSHYDTGAPATQSAKP